MANTVKILNKKRELDKVRVWVEFDNGKTGKNNELVQQDFLIDSLAGLKGELRNRIARFEGSDALEKDLTVGAVDLTPELVIEPSPTPEQIKRDQYRDKLDELRKKKSFVDLGILTKEDMFTLQVEVKQLATELGEI
jgi:hypothetical protein